MLNDQNQILLQRRGDDNNWCIPGGGMDLGETVEETAIREVFEETGLNIVEMTLFNIYSGKQQHHIYPNGDEVYFVNVVFISRKYHGHIIIDDFETKELKYFDLTNIPDKLSMTNVPILDDLRKRIKELN